MRLIWAAVLAAAAVATLATPCTLSAQEPAARPPAAAAETPITGTPAAGTDAASPAGAAVQTVPALAATLTDPDPAAAPADRLEAARRLAARQSDDARQVLRETVTNVGNTAARVAALRALADERAPDPRLLPDLRALLDNENERVVDAAAQALAAYKGNAEALDALARAAAAPRRPAPLRVPVVRALGQMVEQPAAAALVRIVTSRDEPPAVVAAAADALAEMTALDANGRDAARWQQWHNQNGARPPAEWKADLLNARAARADRLRRRAAEATEDVRQILVEQYDQTPADLKPARLLRYLGGATPMVRRIGAGIAEQNASLAPRQNTPEVQERLVALVGDADPGVRLDVVRALYNINVDPTTTLAALRAQLRVETDPAVKAAVAQKLSNMPRVEQLRDLGDLLNDPSPVVVQAAAEAIQRRAGAVVSGQMRDPALAAQTAQRLQEAITRLGAAGGGNLPGVLEARRTSGEALAALRQQPSMDFARALLRGRNEPAEMRGVALTILGHLGPQASQLIIDAVNGEPVPAVRADGMRALGQTRSFAQSEWLTQRMSDRGPGSDPDRDVRKAAREAYLTLLPEADARKLMGEATRWQQQNDPVLRIEVLKVLVPKLRASGQAQAAAQEQESLGTEYLRLTPPQPADAVANLRAALDYWREQGAGQEVTGPIVSRLIGAMLRARQYTALTTLAEDLIGKASPNEVKGLHGRFGPSIRNEVERLLNEAERPAAGGAAGAAAGAAELDNAGALVDAALQMDPPLDEFSVHELKKFGARRDDLRRRRGRGAAAR